MSSSTDHDRRYPLGGPIDAWTLGLLAVATIASFVADLGPGASVWPAVSQGLALFGVAATVGRCVKAKDGRSGSPRRTMPVILTVPIVTFAFTSPLAEAALRAGSFPTVPPLEVVLLGGVRNLLLMLAAFPALLGRRRESSRLLLVGGSLFLVLASSVLTDHAMASVCVAGFVMLGCGWLAATQWRSEGRMSGGRTSEGRTSAHLTADGPPGRLPWAVTVATVMVVGLTVAAAAAGPQRLSRTLVGLLPSSGGVERGLETARAGVGDGPDEALGGHNATSVGYDRSDVFVESDRPGLYDAFVERFGAPVPPGEHRRRVAIRADEVRSPESRVGDDLRAGREFPLIRRPPNRSSDTAADRVADALLYVTPARPGVALHLALNAYDRYDGDAWRQAAFVPTSAAFDNADDDRVFRLAEPPRHPTLGRSEAVTVKVGRLDTHVLPLPGHIERFRVGRVQRADFFAAAQPGLLRSAHTPLPPGASVEGWCRVAGPPDDSLATPPSGHAADVPAAVAALAAGWAGDIGESSRRVEAVLSRLRDHAVYDPDVVTPPDIACPATHFLTVSRRGGSYHFASAAVLLLRAASIDARLVTGFYVNPDGYDSAAGHTPVHADAAHAWVQVRLDAGRAPGGGRAYVWTPLEPTPGFSLAEPPPTLGLRVTRWLAATLHRTIGTVRDLAVPLATVAMLLCVCFARRRSLTDMLDRTVWAVRFGRPPRDGFHHARLVRSTVSLLERRAARHGSPRPPGVSVKAWLGGVAVRTGSPDPAHDACRHRLVTAFDTVAYGPESCGDIGQASFSQDWSACRAVVRLGPGRADNNPGRDDTRLSQEVRYACHVPTRPSADSRRDRGPSFARSPVVAGTA